MTRDLYRRCGGRPHVDQARPQDDQVVALDDTQFQAAVDLLKRRKPPMTGAGRTPRAGWTLPVRDRKVGTTWQIITNLFKGKKPPVAVNVIKPPKGARAGPTPGSSTPRPRTCLGYAYIDYLTSPETNAKIASVRQGAGELESVRADGRQARSPSSTPTTRLSKDVWNWQTPTEDCVDGRTDVKCKGFDASSRPGRDRGRASAPKRDVNAGDATPFPGCTHGTSIATRLRPGSTSVAGAPRLRIASLASAPRLALLLGLPLLWLVVSFSARSGSCSSTRSGRETLSLRSSSGLHARQLHHAPHDRGLPRRHYPYGHDRPARHPDLHRLRLSDRLLRGPRGVAARPGDHGGRGGHAALGELPDQRRTRGD